MVLIGSGVSSPLAAVNPENLPRSIGENASSTNRVDMGNGSYVDVTVDGNMTTLDFSDGSRIIVDAAGNETVLEIHNSTDDSEFTRMHFEPAMDFGPLPKPFDSITPPQSSLSLDALTGSILAPGLVVEEVDNTQDGLVKTEIVAMSLTSSDPIMPSGFALRTTERSSISSPPVVTDFSYAWNESHSGGSVYHGIPDLNQSIKYEFMHKMDPSSFGLFDSILTEQTPSSLMTYAINTYQVFEGSIQSLFTVDANLNLADGRVQDHTISGSTDGNTVGGSSIFYNNQSSGATFNDQVPKDSAPVSGEFPSRGNPLIPFSSVEYSLTSDSVQFIFESFTLVLYVDKLVINYLTESGYYVPIVIYYEVLEVVIVIQEITIIVYLQVIELIMVVIIYEIIKIEVYIEYIILIIEVLLTIIEITIWIVDITIIYIEISITINIFIIHITINVNIIKRIIILPIWIWIIFVPVFIPVFIPIFIPVPTPTPFVMPRVDVDLAEQKFDPKNGLMNLTYFVSDEYDNPISGANVTVVVDNGVKVESYRGVEDPNQNGYYTVTNAVYAMNAMINVTADTNSYRPLGKLSYEQGGSGATQTVTTTITSVDTTTVTSNGNSSSTASSPLPLPFMPILLTLVIYGFVTVFIRRKKTSI